MRDPDYSRLRLLGACNTRLSLPNSSPEALAASIREHVQLDHSLPILIKALPTTRRIRQGAEIIERGSGDSVNGMKDCSLCMMLFHRCIVCVSSPAYSKY